MRRPFLVNSALLLVATALAVAVWLSTEQQNREANITLTSLTPNQVNSIIIENGSGPAVHLERKTDGWTLTQPSTEKADQAKVEKLLQITQGVSIRRFEAPQDLTEFGLSPPQATITLNQTRIEMGVLHPINQRRYIRVGNTVHLTNDLFYHLLQRAPKSLAP
jgi:hypothetical protein